MLKLYNSLTREKEEFKPLVANKIGIYVCGITVYDLCHIGHARSNVCFDVMVRFLRSIGEEVKFVRNITDIDDKIIKRAAERNVSINELTEQYIKDMHEDFKALGILAPDIEPRATTHIAEIIALIEKLISEDVAYVSGNGDVCFEVSKYNNYGKLSNKDLDSLISGARIEIDDNKRSPHDFVLWKKAKEGEPSFDSPWGLGRPGWHIECSAMAMKELGEQFDIHGGGLDLQFPHHENEIAQSEAATHKPFANYWLHVGMLQVNNEKMSKSLGNFFTIREILKDHHPEVIRYFLLSSHYRSPLNYSEENFHNAYKALLRLYQSLKDIVPADNLDEHWVAKFNTVMQDDFNTPLALSVLFNLANEINKTKSQVLAGTLKHLGGVLGILQQEPNEFLQSGFGEREKEKIESLIAKRAKAREEKNWSLADKIRDELDAMKIDIEDGPQGTTWRYRS